MTISVEKISAKSPVGKGGHFRPETLGGKDVDIVMATLRQSTAASPVTVRTHHILKPLPTAVATGDSPLSKLRSTIRELNAKETVLNAAKFPPLADDSLVILVQVHKRLEYLRHLLRSLQEVKGVENILLVLSHDYYDEGINGAVREITFCKVIVGLSVL